MTSYQDTEPGMRMGPLARKSIAIITVIVGVIIGIFGLMEIIGSVSGSNVLIGMMLLVVAFVMAALGLSYLSSAEAFEENHAPVNDPRLEGKHAREEREGGGRSASDADHRRQGQGPRIRDTEQQVAWRS